MALAPLAPEGFSIGLFAVGIFALCITFLLIGLRGAWIYTFGAIMERLSDVRINLPGRHDLHPLRFLHNYNVAVQNDITKRIQKSQAVSGYFFHGAAIIMAWTAREVAALGTDVLHWGQSLQNVKMPRLTKAMIIAAFPLPWLARRVAALVRAHVVPATRRTIHTVTHVVTTRVVRVVKATAGAVAIPLPHIRVFPRLRELGQQIGRTRRQLRRLAYFTTATGAAVLVAKAFGRMGLNWLRCRNVSKVGRGICRMDLGVLNFLLGTATAVFALSHLCELVGYIQRATSLALPSILALVNETEGYVCGGSKSLPSGIVATDGKRVAAFPTGVTHP